MLLMALPLLGWMASCNSDSSTQTEEPAVTISTVAVKQFTLKADNKVLANLDSVFFSIDLNRGLIFNADSLPKGTNISRLIPVITFQTGVMEAKIVMKGGEKTDTVNYITNSTDSIDFTRDVTLNVTAADGVNKYSYRLKVNVHEQKPDSLMWDRMAVASLPSRLQNPAEQRSVKFGDKVYSLIEENDGSLTMSTTDNLIGNEWEKNEFTPGFAPDVRSMTATDDALWILADDGSLHTSTDGLTWTATGETWTTIVGPFSGSVLGVKATADGLSHCHYPAIDGISDPAVDPEFPLTGRTDLQTIPNKWAANPTAIFHGGVKASGDLSDATWAFDGTNWTVINSGNIPAIADATMIGYVDYRKTGAVFQQKEYSVWMLTGGRLSDGSLNKTVYLSGDNGVTWKTASTLMQLPEWFPALTQADGMVISSPLNADLADTWAEKATRSPERWLKPAYTLDGYDITWLCPYVYIIGGFGSDGILTDEIRRGAIARLTFTPII